MENLMHNISLSQFKKIFSDSPHLGLGDEFYIFDASLTEHHKPLAHPCRFDCFMLIYCVNGHIKLNVNLEEYDLKDSMLFMNYPGNIIRVNQLVQSEQSDLRYICVMMSRGFVSNLMLDVNKIFTNNKSIIDHPIISLNKSQEGLLCEHMSVILKIMKDDTPFKDECVRSVISSVMYFLSGVWAASDFSNENKTEAISNRTRMLVDGFIKLVSEYHTSHRNVGFYADKLCLTPKYLSRVVRDVTGRSAPEWIDAFVILEAKNLLKYSGLAIKEIVYKLSFPNQSVFYKFFKSRTGMTPSEYRHS